MMKSEKFAVFDVDDTLLGFKSLFDFARFYCRQVRPDIEFELWHGELQALAQKKGRSAANQAFYRLFEGCSVEVMNDLIRRWSDAYISQGLPVVSSSYQALLEHQSRAERVLFLSGSARIFLQPIADALGVTDLICTDLQVDQGRLTGATLGPAVIGEGKCTQLQRFIQDNELMAMLGTGYGDHASDAFFMQALGKGVVVGNDPLLMSLAEQSHWQIFPALPHTLISEFSRRVS